MIQVLNAFKTFNEGTLQAFKALHPVSFSVKKGETLILKGPSGSGKSTLLGLIAGLYAPSGGEIIVEKSPISRLPEHFSAKFRREKIGFIFQQFHLIPTLNVLENILIPSLPDKIDAHERAKELLRDFELETKADTLVSLLSGGEQQRVALIRALIRNPQIILADEPTANLDASLIDILIKTLEELQKKGKTLIIATHDPILLEWKGAHKTISLNHGKLE